LASHLSQVKFGEMKTRKKVTNKGKLIMPTAHPTIHCTEAYNMNNNKITIAEYVTDI